MKFLETIETDSDDLILSRMGKSEVLTHISLFTGCGGMDVGFANAGIETRLMIEWDHYACETLRHNFLWENLKNEKKSDGTPMWKSREELIEQSKLARQRKDSLDAENKYAESIGLGPTWYHYPEPVIMERDITTVSTEEILSASRLKIGECTIVSGGFPCQGFSLAGKRVIEDPRNKLYKEFVRIVDEIKPLFVVAENVPGLVSMAKGEIMKQICHDFANCGYNIKWDILDAANYGVPQHRRRVIIIGERVDGMILKEDGRTEIHMGCKPGIISHPDFFIKKYKLNKIENKTCRECETKITEQQFLTRDGLCTICYNQEYGGLEDENENNND